MAKFTCKSGSKKQNRKNVTIFSLAGKGVCFILRPRRVHLRDFKIVVRKHMKWVCGRNLKNVDKLVRMLYTMLELSELRTPES